ncbi:MAG: T9SS type A sorting domain-containing protein [Bacteroidia bacterium]|nr:T9SS type A sorting domain-containing protein [Bacteroidia bacterium]
MQLYWKWSGNPPEVEEYHISLITSSHSFTIAKTVQQSLQISAGDLPATSEWLFRVEAISPSGGVIQTSYLRLSSSSCDWMEVFSNPFTDRIHYTFCGEQGGEALLYDSQGRLLARFPVQSGGGSWEVPAGLYFLKREGGSSTIRLWKQ